MPRSNYIFTSESVSEGHPDKLCDRISDAVLDAFIAEEPEARVAAETFATTNRVVIGGEVGLSDKEKLSQQMGQIEQIKMTKMADCSESLIIKSASGIQANGEMGRRT